MTDDGEVKTRSRGPHRGVGRPRLPSFKETVDTADKILADRINKKLLGNRFNFKPENLKPYMMEENFLRVRFDRGVWYVTRFIHWLVPDEAEEWFGQGVSRIWSLGDFFRERRSKLESDEELIAAVKHEFGLFMQSPTSFSLPMVMIFDARDEAIKLRAFARREFGWAESENLAPLEEGE